LVDTSYVLPGAPRLGIRTFAMDRENLAVAAVLGVALVLGLATAGHYGLSVDEFNTDDYGPKALAWYTSGFVDRAHFETVEAPLWMYGPWFQMLVASVQSLHLGDPITVRHALTYVTGLAGLAAVVPIARLTVGRWAGLAALTLCLLTGYLYGSLFFTPIDVPFLFAMSFATLAIVVMARGDAPGWGATIAAGLFTGLAIATRTGGVITHAYLFGAMALCALEALLRGRAPRVLARIALTTAVAIVLAWITAFALWPWLQIGNPLAQFAEAYGHFAKLDKHFEFVAWGRDIYTDELPWWYIPGQMLARLPEGFLALLAIGIGSGAAVALVFAKSALSHVRRRGLAGLRAPLLALAGVRKILVVAVAAFSPLLFLIAQQATLYDGLRHVLFVIPMLAVVAGAGLLRILPVLRRLPLVSGAVAAAYAATLIATMVALHPLEYAAMSAFAGGTRGAQGRFELDYWSLAVPEALRRLEQRLDERAPGAARPRVLVCIPWREHLAGLMFRRDWIAETDAEKADFLIETERLRCAQGKGAVLIDEVKRLDRSFAWIYARK
jgi:hypothetical protein